MSAAGDQICDTEASAHKVCPRCVPLEMLSHSMMRCCIQRANKLILSSRRAADLMALVTVQNSSSWFEIASTNCELYQSNRECKHSHR